MALCFKLNIQPINSTCKNKLKYFCALTQSLNFSISASQMLNKRCYHFCPFFPIPVVYSGEQIGFYPVLVKFSPCGAPSLTWSTKCCERLRSEWYQLLGQPSKKERALGTIQVTSAQQRIWAASRIYYGSISWFFCPNSCCNKTWMALRN